MKNLISLLAIFACSAMLAQNTLPSTQVNGSMKIDSVITVHGETTMKDTVHAEKDVKIAGNVYVEGGMNVQGDFKLGQNFTMSETTNSTGQPFLFLGNPNHKTAAISSFGFTCINNFASPNNFIKTGNNISIFGVNPNVSNLYSSLEMGYDGKDAYIDVTGGANISQPGQPNPAYNPSLLINNYCGKDVIMCAGTNGQGTVKIGHNVEIGSPVRNANIALNMQITNSYTKGLAIFNTTVSKEVFSVENDGKTHIGVGRPLIPGTAQNAMLSVDGLILAKEIRVALTTTHWADYVFEKNYELPPLKEVESYILKYKHLEGVPSEKEVMKDGIDMAEMNAALLKKIEELTLYVIRLEKQVNELKK